MVHLRASQIHQVFLCPGSFWAQEGLPEPIDTEGYADRGTRIHAALANPHLAKDLNKEELEAYNTCLKLEAQVLSAVNKEGGTDWFLNEMELVYGFFTGHIDAVYVWKDGSGKNYALIIDRKTGWIKVSEPAQNLQLRCYVYLLFRRHPELDVIYVQIIQPMVKKPEPAMYVRDDIKGIESELMAIYMQAINRGAARTPNPMACRYCKAFGTVRCPESSKQSTALLAYSSFNMLPPEKRGEALKLAISLLPLIKKMKAEAALLLRQDPSSVPGFKLKEGKKTKSIRDIHSAYEKLQDLLTDEEFNSCLEVSSTKLEDIYKTKSEYEGKMVKEKFIERMGEALIIKQGAPYAVMEDETEVIDV